ncbi:alpha-(1-_3)-arabinofuranosyltransferase [Nostocoides veronense]|uniref:Alpha-(1->3)-arabinofuranosyltransferase n=1 Tax=Nostocoides veronense TaxID=330836 RepID=A0ABP4XM42_9MICO
MAAPYHVRVQARAERKIPHGSPSLSGSSRPTGRLLTLAGLLVVWTVAWSTPAGQIGEDTKNDLYVDAWGLMRRALHLWDPQVTWGMLQNQGYGYLFPMGPFYAVLSEVLPVWLVQRLWWSALLTIGFLATLAVLRALGYGRYGAVHVGALAYALAPRVLSTMGAISPEAQTQLLAPAILLPLVLADRGRLSTRRAAALSGVAILLCGGVNATATLLAAVPAGVWLVTRRRWWRRSLTWAWALAAAAASAWWLGPLLLLGRYSPPFLHWIENAAAVVSPLGLLDVLKGTDHWLGHLLVTGGPWWPAGWAIADSRTIVIASGMLAGASLAGLALPIRERRFLLLTLLLGLILLVLPQSGALASPMAPAMRDLLDGPLAPLRNVHKADPLVRLPFAIGLVNLLGYAARALRHRALAPAVAAGLVLVVAGPALSGVVATRGTFTEMPRQWRDAGAWLDAHADQGGAIILPSSSFAEYTWGRTIDEPLRSLTSAPYAVRDAVPLTPAGTIRLLDEVQRRAQSARDLRGAVPALLAAGVKYVVLRNDLDTRATGGDLVILTRSALVDTKAARRVAGFGQAIHNETGQRVSPVEIFALDGEATPPATLWPLASLPVVSGASEALPALQESALAAGPVIFDGDASTTANTAPRIETDTLRARTRYFGATRGHDITRTLTLAEAAEGIDYLPWPDLALRSVVTFSGGLASVTASSALSDQLSLAGLFPARRPYAALDGDPDTAWIVFGDPDPTLTIRLTTPRKIPSVRLLPTADPTVFGRTVAAATRVEITFAGQRTEAAIAPTGTRVALPAGEGAELRIRILQTAGGNPADVATGLAEVSIPDLHPGEAIALPDPQTKGPTQAIVASRDTDAFDGCVRTEDGYQCLSGGFRPAEDTGPLTRIVRTTAAGSYVVSGALMADPAHRSALLKLPGIESVTASSSRTLGAPGDPLALLDGLPETAWSPATDDRTPSIHIAFDAPQRVTGLRVRARADWLDEHAPMAVSVTRDGTREVSRLRRDGTIELTAATTRTLDVEFLPDAGTSALAAAEFSALALVGAQLPAVNTTVGVPCGSGPTLRVGGKKVPTAVIADRAALMGTAAGYWQACERIDLPAGEIMLSVGTWESMVPASLLARTADAAVAGSVRQAGQPLPTRAYAGGRRTGSVTSASFDRVLALTQNTNPGWRATLDGRALAPQIVDGYRQAFLIPTGAAGEVVVEFGPDRAYRTALLFGAVLAGGLVLTAIWPARRRAADTPEAPQRAPQSPPQVRHRRAFTALLAILGGVAVASWPGALVGLVMTVLALRVRSRGALPLAALVLATSAAIVHAVAASGLGPGSPAIAGTTRLLSLAALLCVLLAPAARVRAGAPPTASAATPPGDSSASPEPA